MPPPSPTGFPIFDVDDDALFQAPVAYTTWEGCVEAWNRCAAYEEERCHYLSSVVERTAANRRLQPEDRGFLEMSLDALAGKIALALEIQHRAFDRACRLRYGFGVGDVIEANTDDGIRLCEIRDGFLPIDGDEPSILFKLNMVEPFQNGWLSVCVGSPIINCLPEDVPEIMRLRPDVKATKPTDS